MVSISRRLSVLADASGDQDLVFDAYPAKTRIRWSRFVTRDVDNTPTRNEIILRRHTSDLLVKCAVQGAAARCVSAEVNLLMPGDYQVVGRFVGATEGDTLEMYAFGERVR